MNEILAVVVQKGATTITIQLWHIWSFVILVCAMTFVKWGRAIAIFCLLTAIVLGWQDGLGTVKDMAITTPTQWITYLLGGSVMLAGLALTFAVKD